MSHPPFTRVATVERSRAIASSRQPRPPSGPHGRHQPDSQRRAGRCRRAPLPCGCSTLSPTHLDTPPHLPARRRVPEPGRTRCRLRGRPRGLRPPRRPPGAQRGLGSAGGSGRSRRRAGRGAAEGGSSGDGKCRQAPARPPPPLTRGETHPQAPTPSSSPPPRPHHEPPPARALPAPARPPAPPHAGAGRPARSRYRRSARRHGCPSPVLTAAAAARSRPG